MPPRNIWKGSISFGLVNIPIKLYTATEDRAYSFNQLCENGHRIRYKRWCPVEEREVPYDEIKKGYEISKDNYVLIEKSELKQLSIKTTKTIDVKEFVDWKDLDPILIERSYYVGPESKGADKAYSLLTNILKSTKKIAVGKVVLRDKEQLVALRAYQRGIVMHVLHFIDEIRPMDEIPAITAVASAGNKPNAQELNLGKTLVEQLSSKGFDLSDYSDAYTKQVEQLIAAKSKGQIHVVKEEEVAETTDLLAALKASVSKSTAKQKRGPRMEN